MSAPTVTGSTVLTDTATPWGAVIVAAGEMDMTAVPELRRRLDAAVSRGVRRLLLDLSDVTFIDTISLAAIVAAQRRMGEGGRLAIAASHPFVLLILEAGGLDSVVEAHPTVREAEAALLG